MDDLIEKHLNGKKDDIFWRASVEFYMNSGHASGGFYMALKEMMKEYHKQQVKLFATPAVIKSVYCDCKNRSSFYRDKEDNDICYDCDRMIKQ